MKKLSSLLLILLTFAGLSFAKTITITADKLRTVNNVAKISNQLGMDIIENYSNLWVAKASDSDDFAVYYEEEYDDGKLAFAMVCVDGQMISRISLTEKQASGPALKMVLREYDKAVIFNDNGNNVYLTDFGVHFETVVAMEHRNRIRSWMAEKYNLLIPEITEKNDKNFRSVFEKINPELSEDETTKTTVNHLKEIIESNFAY